GRGKGSVLRRGERDRGASGYPERGSAANLRCAAPLHGHDARTREHRGDRRRARPGARYPLSSRAPSGQACDVVDAPGDRWPPATDDPRGVRPLVGLPERGDAEPVGQPHPRAPARDAVDRSTLAGGTQRSARRGSGRLPVRSSAGRPGGESGQNVLRRLLYRFYEARLLGEIVRGRMPLHLGLIQDGHRRYARKAGLSRLHGYRRGAAKAEEVLSWCRELQIPMVTLWWLSTENLGRDPEDVGAVLDVIDSTVPEWTRSGFTTRLGIRIRAIGQLELLPDAVQRTLREAESATRQNDRL